VRVREWLEETHSAGFELRRHFFARFFDSELVASQGQWQVVAYGTMGIVASLVIVLTQAYYSKYLALIEMETPELYNLAWLADHLFFVTLSMTLTGLMTALQWPALFPGLRDYLVLAGLPVRPRQIFTAKFTALGVFVGTFIVAINLLPAIMLPAVMAGRYQVHGGHRFMILLVSTVAAGFFVFFALVALQGLLLNLVPARQFQRISLVAQGGLFFMLLAALPLVLSIPGWTAEMATRPHWAVWAPPLWFMGLGQAMLGFADPLAPRLAERGLWALLAAMLFAGLAYVWSYRKHRVRLIETPVEPGMAGNSGAVREFVNRNLEPGERAVYEFLTATLGRSRQHRMVLTLFVAVATALVVSGFASAGLGNLAVRSFAIRHAAFSAPLALTLFGLAGYVYLFRLPVELRANWTHISVLSRACESPGCSSASISIGV